jgi:hypothetical protein
MILLAERTTRLEAHPQFWHTRFRGIYRRIFLIQHLSKPAFSGIDVYLATEFLLGTGSSIPPAHRVAPLFGIVQT